jgi:hypothetical protein
LTDVGVIFLGPVARENPGDLVYPQLAVKFIFVQFPHMCAEALEDFGSEPDIDRSPVCWTAFKGGEDAFV